LIIGLKASWKPRGWREKREEKRGWEGV